MRWGVGASHQAHLLAERAGVGEEQGCVEPVDEEPLELASRLVAGDVVESGKAVHLAELCLVGPPRTAEHVEDGQGDGDGDPWEHAEQDHAEDLRRLGEEIGDEPQLGDASSTMNAPTSNASIDAKAIAVAGSPSARTRGMIVAAIMGPSEESGPSTRMRDGPNTA